METEQMTLKQVVFSFRNVFPEAEQQFIRIALSIRMLKDCRWWQFIRRRQLIEALIEEIREIDKAAAQHNLEFNKQD